MHLVCPACLTTNRVPDARLHEDPVCGRCRAALMAVEPHALSDAALQVFVANSGLPVLVDFWAEWCGPCKAMAPQFALAAQKLPEVRFIKVDSDQSPKASVQHRIRSIPTLILFENGNEVARTSGAMMADELVRWVRHNMAGT